MASLADSRPVFEARLVALRLHDFGEQFLFAEVYTHAEFAFMTGLDKGGKVPDETFLRDIVKPILGREDHPEKTPDRWG